MKSDYWFPCGMNPKRPVPSCRAWAAIPLGFGLATLGRLWLWVLAVPFAGSIAHAADSPTLIPFQGRLTDQQGVAYTNGTYTIIFNLYELPVGGQPIWQERHQSVGVINGMLNVFLGSISNLNSISFTNARHLGITLDADNNANTADPEMIPRQLIIPAFWAKSADNATKLGGYDWSDLLASGNDPKFGFIAGAKLVPNSVSAAQIENSAVTSDKILNGAVTANKLSLTASSIQRSFVEPPQVHISETVAVNNDFVNDADTPTDVPNLTVTVPVTGRPLLLQLIGEPGTNTTINFSFVAFYKSNGNAGTARGEIRFVEVTTSSTNDVSRLGANGYGSDGQNYMQMPPSAFSHLHLPTGPPGDRTYKVQVLVPGADTRVQMSGVRLAVMEF